ncbi:hypothetical protein DS742_10785 [Lacrimispora amygdalina]|uniref:Uncharacterized protein n=1 Tax=Lacrimispora amygdalina TaxID=253257 RepID=A0A3E2ND78_9FIRM|nr:hypothetical protein [Clostridium indicum]RFZ78840.1 hypothetical protein DS742_10785 [Clostridium indicum]
MLKNKKVMTAIAAGVLVVAGIVFLAVESAGGSTDVIGKKSVQSYEMVLNAIPDLVRKDDEGKGFTLTAPDSSVRFTWSSASDENSRYDLKLQADAAPFISAGLDTGKLPADYDVSDDLITMGMKLKEDGSADTDESPLSAYEGLVKNDRSLINYHGVMDHFGVKLGGGNMFEWAKNLETSASTGKTQDKDIVFVLEPEPFIAAGVDPEKVEGWIYAPVTVMEHGKKMQVNKFLKPFDIK